MNGTVIGPRIGQRLSAFDYLLVVVFLLGLYTGISLQITSSIPLPCAPSGIAGLAMLWRRRNQIEPGHVLGLLAVLTVYLLLSMAASNPAAFPKRFNGLVQLTYSMVISYGFFLTVVCAERRIMANILLGFSLLIIVGCVLESNTGLRAISDAFRDRVYAGEEFYDADVRDYVLYGRPRPKLFTSEPSFVTFAYTQFCWAWLLISQWRFKLLIYLGLIGVATIALPGPTLMLMFLLAVPGIILLREGGRGASFAWLIGATIGAIILLAAAVLVGQLLFAERLHQLSTGRDPSFFYRFTGPMLVAFEIFRTHPLTGAGLTGEAFIAQDVLKVFMNSSSFDAGWQTAKIAGVLTNYFWLHWIYLGLLGGVASMLAISYWLRRLGVPSVLYCWIAWTILGQAAGAYVAPRTWAVLFIAAAASILYCGNGRRIGAGLRPVKLVPRMEMAS